MYEDLASAKSRVIGAKQTMRALERGCVHSVYIAADADERVVRQIRALCHETGVQVLEVGSMDELGRVCGIDVGAASAAILHE